MAATMRDAKRMAPTYLSDATGGGSRQRAGAKDQAGAQHDANGQRNNPNVLPWTTGGWHSRQTRRGQGRP